MGIKVQLDQSTRQSPASSTSGLLLGTSTQQLRILYLVPTPKKPPGASPHRWAVEHANLIRPMCPGGLSILGTYLPLRGASPSQTKHFDSAAAIARDISYRSQNSQTPLVLGKGPKGRVVVKHVPASPQDILRSTDLKEIPKLTHQVLTIRANLFLPQTLFPIIYNFTTPEQFSSACYTVAETLVSHSIIQLPDELRTVVTTTEDDRSLAEAMALDTGTKNAQKHSSFSREPIHVQMMTPVCVDCDQQISTSDQTENAPPVTSLQGTLHLEAVATMDATVGDVMNALQEDLRKSLKTRLDLLIETYMPDPDDDSTVSEPLWREPNVFAFPARVVASPISVTAPFFSLTEYLMPNETVDENLVSRFLEAFTWDEERLEEFKIEQKECHRSESTENLEISSPISPREDEASCAISSENSAIDIQYVMQASLIVAFAVAVLAILIKEILDYL